MSSLSEIIQDLDLEFDNQQIASHQTEKELDYFQSYSFDEKLEENKDDNLENNQPYKKIQQYNHVQPLIQQQENQNQDQTQNLIQLDFFKGVYIKDQEQDEDDHFKILFPNNPDYKISSNICKQQEFFLKYETQNLGTLGQLVQQEMNENQQSLTFSEIIQNMQKENSIYEKKALSEASNDISEQSTIYSDEVDMEEEQDRENYFDENEVGVCEQEEEQENFSYKKINKQCDQQNYEYQNASDGYQDFIKSEYYEDQSLDSTQVYEEQEHQEDLLQENLQYQVQEISQKEPEYELFQRTNRFYDQNSSLVQQSRNQNIQKNQLETDKKIYYSQKQIDFENQIQNQKRGFIQQNEQQQSSQVNDDQLFADLNSPIKNKIQKLPKDKEKGLKLQKIKQKIQKKIYQKQKISKYSKIIFKSDYKKQKFLQAETLSDNQIFDSGYTEQEEIDTNLEEKEVNSLQLQDSCHLELTQEEQYNIKKNTPKTVGQQLSDDIIRRLDIRKQEAKQNKLIKKIESIKQLICEAFPKDKEIKGKATNKKSWIKLGELCRDYPLLKYIVDDYFTGDNKLLNNLLRVNLKNYQKKKGDGYHQKIISCYAKFAKELSYQTIYQ